MTNKEKFKEVFGKELDESLRFDTSCSQISQIVALRSMYIIGVDNIIEWFNAEYEENNREKSTIDILEQVKTKISKLTTCELGSWQEITAGEMRNDAINEVDKFICKLKGEWI